MFLLYAQRVVISRTYNELFVCSKPIIVTVAAIMFPAISVHTYREAHRIRTGVCVHMCVFERKRERERPSVLERESRAELWCPRVVEVENIFTAKNWDLLDCACILQAARWWGKHQLNTIKIICDTKSEIQGKLAINRINRFYIFYILYKI